MKHLDEYRRPEVAGKILANIKATSKREIRLMEVCGTHTVAIFRSGIRNILPENISLISGPGCPVCVTPNEDIDRAMAISRQKDIILTTCASSLVSIQKPDSSGLIEVSPGGN